MSQLPGRPRLEKFQPGKERRRLPLPQSRRTRLAVIAVVLAVIAGLIVVSIPKSFYNKDALDKKQGIGRYAGQLSEAQQAQAARLIPRLKQFVAMQRGGAFPSDVTVHFVSDQQFTAAVNGESFDSAHGSLAVDQALGGSGGQQFVSHAKKVNQSDIDAFEDPEQHAIYMHGSSVDLEQADILVHELTHAWDESRFHDLAALAASNQATDRFNAGVAVIEGDATEVQGDYLDTINANLGCQVMDELGIPFDSICRKLTYTDDLTAINPGDLDAPIEAYQQFPYTIGTLFVRSLIAHGGEDAVDAAFRDPPIDTAQVIEPTLYVSHIKPVTVPPPAVSGTARRVRSRGTLGELGESVVVTGGGLDLGRARYLLGWAGDSYVRDTERGKTCLRDHLVLRSPRYAATALARFRTWAGLKPGRTVHRNDARSLTFANCH